MHPVRATCGLWLVKADRDRLSAWQAVVLSRDDPTRGAIATAMARVLLFAQGSSAAVAAYPT
jgi:hypothetical protein